MGSKENRHKRALQKVTGAFIHRSCIIRYFLGEEEGSFKNEEQIFAGHLIESQGVAKTVCWKYEGGVQDGNSVECVLWSSRDAWHVAWNRRYVSDSI